MKAFVSCVLMLFTLVGALRAQSERYLFMFYTDRSPEEIFGAVGNDPDVNIMVSNTNSGRKVTLVGCTQEEGSAVRGKVVGRYGEGAVQEWSNLTPREWKSETGRELSEMKNPGFSLPSLTESALAELTEAEKTALTADLIYILENYWTRGTFGREWQLHQAIRALGRLKSAEAVPILLKRIDFVPTGLEPLQDAPVELKYPATVALVRIGEPAKTSLIAALQADSELKRNLAAWTMIHSIGLDETLNIVKQSAADGKLSAVDANAIDTYARGYARRWGKQGAEIKDL